MTILATITYIWEGDCASEHITSHERPTAVIQANGNNPRYGSHDLQRIVFQPYLSHSQSWVLKVEFDDGSEHVQGIDIPGAGDNDCELRHDPNKQGLERNVWACEEAQGVAGWTLKVKTQSKVRLPDPLDALQAATNAAEHSAKAALEAAKAAVAAIQALRAHRG